MAKYLIHPKLTHLSQQDLEEVLRCYYANEKVGSILTKYGIDCAPSAFHTILPPLVLPKQVCPACGASMIQPHISRGRQVWLRPSTCCSKCRHEDAATCNCSFCDSARVAEKEALISAQRAEIVDFVRRNFPGPSRQIAATSLSLRDAVSLLALFRSCRLANGIEAKGGYTLEPLSEASTPFTPEYRFKSQLLSGLLDRELIAPSTHCCPVK